MNQPMAVLAGTPVDTQMGMDVLQDNGLAGMAFPVSQNPREQTAFQVSSTDKKYQTMLTILHRAQEQGCRKAFIYCNSLSSSVDFHHISKEIAMPIVTPLDVYQQLAPRYHRLGLIAANAQGLSGIEKTRYEANPTLDILSASLLPVVLSIEAKMEPAALVAHHHLDQLAHWMENCQMEALILGCTHFPYFKKELAQHTTLPLIDPTEEMIRLLMARK